MTHISHGELMLLDPKIKRILSILRQITKRERMADPKPTRDARSIMDYVKSSIIGATSRIRRPAVQVNTLEIKLMVIQMIQS